MANFSVESENLKIYFLGQEKASLELDDNRRNKIKEWLHNYPLPPNGHALDVGCWKGEFFELLPKGWHNTGLDLERHPELSTGVAFVAGNASEPLPFPNESFELIFAGEIIEHLLETTRFIAECHRVLKQGGMLFVTTPNLSCWLNAIRWLTLDQPWCVDCDTGENGHVRYFAPRVLARKLRAAGFKILKLTSVGGLERFRPFPWFYKGLFRLFPLRGKCLMCLAHK